jgi:hypothetical protein
MSQPQPEEQGNDTRHTDPALYERQNGDGERDSDNAPAFSWFRKARPGIAPHTAAPVLRAVPSLSQGDSHPTSRANHSDRPAREPEKPAVPKTDPRVSRQLTWEQIDYFIGRERIIDASTDEQYWHDTVLFDEAIEDDRYWRNGRLCDRPMDAEPEIDDPEIG